MVEFKTPQQLPTARAAGQVSNAGSQALERLSGAAGQAAATFTEFYEKEAAIQGELVLAEIQEEWTRGYQERSKGAGAGFAKSTMADYDKFVADRLGQWQQEATEGNQRNVPARVMDDVQLSLGKYRLKLETRALQQEAAARAAAKAAAVAATKRAQHNALISDPSLYPDLMENANKKDAAAFTKTYLTMQLRDNPQAVLDDVMAGGYDAHLQPSEKIGFIKKGDDGVKRMEREAEIVLKGEQDRFERELSEELAFTEANGSPPVDSAFDVDQVRELYGNDRDRERGEEVIRTYQEAVKFSETMHGVSMRSPEELQADWEKLQAEVSKPGDTVDDVKRLNAFETALAKRNAAIQKDPAGYAQSKVDEVQKIYDLHGQADAETQPIIAESYMSALETTYDRLGVPQQLRTVLPANAVTDMVANLNNLGSDVAAQALADYRDSWGDAAPMVIAQLEKGGLASEYITAMRHADNPGLSQAIVNLATVTKADLETGVKSGGKVTDFNAALSEGLQAHRIAFEAGGNDDAIDIFNKSYEVAEKLGLSLVRKGADPAAAAERVIEQMYPETPITNNNMKFILPDGFSGDGVRKVEIGLERLMREEVLRDAGIMVATDDPRFVDFADLENTLSIASRSGIWVNDGTPDGVQLLVPVSGIPIPLLLEDGSPYRVTFKKAEGVGHSFGWDRQ